MSNLLVSGDSLSAQDIDLIQDFYQKNASGASFGEVLPLSTVEGEQVVAILTADNNNLLCAFGKVADWYCAIDSHSNILGQAQALGDLFTMVSSTALT
ncbi:hypothetical protein O4H49_18170 [Kiloniella laminariae]|uniref:Uncharacterized protein n=1 Tax=Kiloniella laminariae TaxID=454162 RepID=A0ABT4LNI6_9PROT|nr:hypothetical protein [Kiloniella laminariae]MCZ4282715.1 hypothetical protein [Kiloniella laminariae]